MSKIDEKLSAMGLILPAPMKVPAGVILPFPEVNIRGNRAFVSGAGPLNADGSLRGPFGQVGSDVTVDEAKELAMYTGLALLGGLKRSLGDLDRITGWCRAFGMVNTAPGFDQPPAVINGVSELILQVFGDEVGRHARSAVGMAGLPMKIAVELEAEVIFE